MVTDDDVGNLWLAQALWDVGAIQFGDFTIGRTTEHSPVYVNLRLLISNPAALARAAGVMLRNYRHCRRCEPAGHEFQAVCAIVWRSPRDARTLCAPACQINKCIRQERNGRPRLVEGRVPEETVTMIDDLSIAAVGVVENRRVPEGERDLDVKDVLRSVGPQDGEQGNS